MDQRIPPMNTNQADPRFIFGRSSYNAVAATGNDDNTAGKCFRTLKKKREVLVLRAWRRNSMGRELENLKRERRCEMKCEFPAAKVCLSCVMSGAKVLGAEGGRDSLYTHYKPIA